MRCLVRSGLLALATLFTTTLLPAQAAAFSTFGQGCTASGLPVPAIGILGLPQLNTTFTLTYTGPNRATWPTSLQPMVMLGFQQAQWPVPPLSSSQPAGCTVYLLADYWQLMPAGGISYVNTFSLTVPNQPILIGTNLVAQWGCVNQTCLVNGCRVNALLTSDAGLLTIGL